MNVSMALMHHPVFDRGGKLQTSSITPFDIHDLSRSATTYGIDRLYVIHPSPLQRQVAERILGFWESGGGKDWNPCRSQALEVAQVLPNLELAIENATKRFSAKPSLVATTAKPMPGQITFEGLKKYFSLQPAILIFGTGWGLSPEIMDKCDLVLEPIWGPTNFNHLSVRSAGAIICDRLFGKSNA